MIEELIDDKSTLLGVAIIRQKVINTLWNKFDKMPLRVQLKFLALLISMNG